MSYQVIVLLNLAALLTACSGCAQQEDDQMTLPSSPTEDMSHLLVEPATATADFDFDAPRDYLPDPNVEWVVTIALEKSVSWTDIPAC